MFATPGHQGSESADSDFFAYAKKVNVSVTPASVNAATAVERDVNVTGAQVGDIVICNPAATGNATLVGAARVKSAGVVSVQYVNPTAGALTPGAGTYTFFLLRKASGA